MCATQELATAQFFDTLWHFGMLLLSTQLVCLLRAAEGVPNAHGILFTALPDSNTM